MTTEYLNTQVSGFVASFSQEGFSDRSQEAQQFVCFLTRFFAFRFLNDVVLLCRQINQCTATFCETLLGQQHTTYVWVNDDWVSCFLRRFSTSQRTHSQAIFRVRQCALERRFSRRCTLQSSTDTGSVHEGEHAVQTFVFRSDQPAFSTVEVHHTGRVTVDTHFVFDRTTNNTVTLARSTVFVWQELRHNKQRDTFSTFWGTRQTSQYDMYDILCHVVFASRDKDFRTSDGVRAVSVCFRFGLQDTEVRTTV